MGKSLFVVGTGTDIGKTYVTGLIIKKLRENGKSSAYFKAAMSGNERDKNGELIPGDSVEVKNISGISQPIEEMSPYIYEKAVSPHLAAKLEGNPLNLENVYKKFKRIYDKYDYITIEGAGGILCPMRFDDEEIWLSDIIRLCKSGCIMVADAGLGTINSAGLTAFYMKEKGIPLKGIILNRFEPGNTMHEDNLKMCEYITGAKVIACVKEGDSDLDISFENLESVYY